MHAPNAAQTGLRAESRPIYRHGYTTRPMTMIREQIRAALADARRRAIEAGDLPAPADAELPPIAVEHPARAEHGDYATNAAMQLAPIARANPMQIAETLARHLERPDGVAEISVERPGFVNFKLDPAWVGGQVGAILQAGEAFGRSAIGQGRSVNLEYISANPTGPLHIGNARGGFIGDAMASVLAATGHAVTREYYVNNAGKQVRDFGESLYLARTGQSGDAGYTGAYIRELAGQAPDEVVGSVNPLEAIGEWGWNRVYDDIKATLGRLRMEFEIYRSDLELAQEGKVTAGIERLRESGHVYDSEGAVWFRSTAFGDDKDRVLVRSSGEPTYLAGDVAYMIDKFERGFDDLVYIWGPDHHGTVPRMKAVAVALGFEPDRVQFIIHGYVRLANGQKMSKRAGTLITLDELIDEIGPDATRFFMTMRSATQHLELDLELAGKQSNENPVYYVQYAHARCSSILRNAAEQDVAADPTAGAEVLTHPAEQALIRRLLALPEVVVDAAVRRETHDLPFYCLETAQLFSAFYRDCRVLTDDARLSAARLALVQAARVVLANALGMFGVRAPDSM
jgi:arginyl-tRNA synthetase